MGKTSNIQWTDATWNIARGCTKVNEDCKFCYMMRDSMNDTRYPSRKVIRTKTVFNLPKKLPPGTKVFLSSLTDWMHPDIDSYRHEVFDIIKSRPDLIFQTLTKRPERLFEMLPAGWNEDPWPNVWIGISAGSQLRYDEAIIHFRKIHAAVKWVSLEPLTQPITKLDLIENEIKWVVVGGESGHDNGRWRYRPCELQWITRIVSECETYGVPVFVKQLGTSLAKQLQLKDRTGGDHNEWRQSNFNPLLWLSSFDQFPSLPNEPLTS